MNVLALAAVCAFLAVAGAALWRQRERRAAREAADLAEAEEWAAQLSRRVQGQALLGLEIVQSSHVPDGVIYLFGDPDVPNSCPKIITTPATAHTIRAAQFEAARWAERTRKLEELCGGPAARWTVPATRVPAEVIAFNPPDAVARAREQYLRDEAFIARLNLPSNPRAAVIISGL